MIHLFQKGDKSNAANFRPVSLTSVMERIVHSRPMKVPDSNKILNDYQHAWLPKKKSL